LPKACGKRRRGAPAPRKVPHLPAREELGGALTARARQPPAKACDNLKWPSRRVPSRLSAIAVPGARVVNRYSWQRADGLFSFSVVLRRNRILRIDRAYSIHGKPRGCDTFLDAVTLASAIVRLRDSNSVVPRRPSAPVESCFSVSRNASTCRDLRTAQPLNRSAWIGVNSRGKPRIGLNCLRAHASEENSRRG